MTCQEPCIDPTARIAPSAVIVGDVSLGADCTVFFNAVLRGDGAGRVVIGEGSNVQENACLHVSRGFDTLVGRKVTIGHGAIVHGCTIGDGTVVGMGAIVIDGARVGRECLIGAGALVTGTADIPDGMLVLGSPARAVRPLTAEERASNLASALNYVEVGKGLVADGYLRMGG